jgi:hypothetical protein
MKSPVKYFSAILVGLAFLSLVGRSQAQDLLSLGNTTFSVDPGSTGPFSQTALTLVFNGTISDSDIVYNDNTLGLDYESYSDFGVKMSLLSGSAQTIPFTIQFADSGGNPLADYQGDTSLLVNVGETVDVPLTLSGTRGDLSAIAYFNISWDGNSTGSYNANMQNITAVPEPSTYALLALSGLAFGGYIIRRRRRA